MALVLWHIIIIIIIITEPMVLTSLRQSLAAMYVCMRVLYNAMIARTDRLSLLLLFCCW